MCIRLCVVHMVCVKTSSPVRYYDSNATRYLFYVYDKCHAFDRAFDDDDDDDLYSKRQQQRQHAHSHSLEHKSASVRWGIDILLPLIRHWFVLFPYPLIDLCGSYGLHSIELRTMCYLSK